MVTAPRSRVNSYGVPGPRGPTGPQGPTGATGSTGATGAGAGAIYVETFLAAAGGDIRAATIAALLSDLTTPGQIFKFPQGRFAFAGAFIRLSDGFRNGITLDFTGCEIYIDEGGVASGQKIMFGRLETDSTHADGITILGGKFSHLNCLTSFFSQAFYISAASNFTVEGTEFYCTLDPAATTGRIRWGIVLFGGQPLLNTGGRNNRVNNVRATCSQIQLCGQGCDVDGIVCTNIQLESANDWGISVVTGPGFSVRNVLIDNVTCHNVTGTGVVFVGNDGTSLGGSLDFFEDVIISNVSLSGDDDFDLSFEFTNCIQICAGQVNRNIQIRGINTVLSGTGTQARSITVFSNQDEISWDGLIISDCSLGIVTTNDPLEALYLALVAPTQVSLCNIHIKGPRGIRVHGADRLVIDNVTMQDGTMTIASDNRNIDSVTISNSIFTRLVGFNAALRFTSSAGKNFSNVYLSNVVLRSNNPSLDVALNGGTMSMSLNNVLNGHQTVTAETLAGIVRAVNVSGIPTLQTTITGVTVPGVAAGSVGYVNVSMAGTRLADLAVGEGVVVCAKADIMAAGVGGGMLQPRVQATGSVRLGFVGPVTTGSFDFTFYRAPV